MRSAKVKSRSGERGGGLGRCPSPSKGGPRENFQNNYANMFILSAFVGKI